MDTATATETNTEIDTDAIAKVIDYLDIAPRESRSNADIASNTGLIVLNGQLGVASAITLSTALVSLYFPLSAWLENRRILRRGRESAESPSSQQSSATAPTSSSKASNAPRSCLASGGSGRGRRRWGRSTAEP